MTKSYDDFDDFRVECAKKFTTAEKFRQVKVKLLEARAVASGRRQDAGATPSTRAP